VSVDAATFVFMMEVGPATDPIFPSTVPRIGRPPHLTERPHQPRRLKARHRCADLMSVTDDGG
jgi:hypothetical protein